MGESGVVENEIEGQIGWEHMFDDIPEDPSLFDPSLLSDLSNSSPPDSFSFSIGEIEQLLMEDDNNDVEVGRGDQSPLEFSNDFLSDILLDSPVESDRSPEIVNLSDVGGKNSNSSSSSSSSEEEHDKIDALPQKDNDNTGNNNDDKIDALPQKDNDNTGNNNEDGDDPINKKRQRQLRNRDAALRSRERRKMYVRDLEMKSRYLEGECKRLGMLLQCCCAENQALRLSLQNAKAFDASMTKQESAVLLLESLLLGSLLWFLGIICLPILPGPLQSTLEAVPPENVDKKNQGSLNPRKAKSKICVLKAFQSFMVSKRCKASRSRMKPCLLIR